MENYIMINGRKIELNGEQAAMILSAFENPTNIKLSDIEVGDTFKLGEHELIVLEQTGDTTAVILKDLLPAQKFGSSNNFDGSDVAKTCCEFAAQVAAIVGEENIIPHTVDLTANDGLKCYGTIETRCSLLTADLYRRFVETLDKYKPDDWWWLATPWSTKKHDNDNYALCVSPSGCFDFNSCYYGGSGVRPFCIFESSIFGSSEA